MSRITKELFEEAKDLRATGLSIRKIAKRIGVSHETLSLAFRGKIKKLLITEVVPGPKIAYPVPVNPNSAEYRMRSCVVEYVRCPRCGGKVQRDVPCMACDVRSKLLSFDCYLAELVDEIIPAWPSPLAASRSPNERHS